MVFEFIREVVSEGQKYNIIFTQEEDSWLWRTQ